MPGTSAGSQSVSLAASAGAAQAPGGVRTSELCRKGCTRSPVMERTRAMAESSPSIVTPLNRVIGYEAAAKVAKHSVATGMTIRESVIDLGFVDRGEVTLEQLDSSLDVLKMTSPGL